MCACSRSSSRGHSPDREGKRRYNIRSSFARVSLTAPPFRTFCDHTHPLNHTAFALCVPHKRVTAPKSNEPFILKSDTITPEPLNIHDPFSSAQPLVRISMPRVRHTSPNPLPSWRAEPYRWCKKAPSHCGRGFLLPSLRLMMLPPPVRSSIRLVNLPPPDLCYNAPSRTRT